jgi:hypothetical protein
MEEKLNFNTKIFAISSNIMSFSYNNQTINSKNIEIRLVDEVKSEKLDFQDDYNYDADTEFNVEGMYV